MPVRPKGVFYAARLKCSAQNSGHAASPALSPAAVRGSQRAMAGLFDVNTQAITSHLGHIYAEGELVKSATCSKMEHVRKEGGRINSVRATKFRIWDASLVALTLILPKATPTKWTR